MNDLQQHLSAADNRPLPLIVAEKFNFKLVYVVEEGVYLYAIQDWIAGLVGSKSRTVRDVWYNLRSRSGLDVSFTLRTLPYLADNGKNYQVDYTTDEGLYLIAQHLEANKNRPLLKTIQKYLAESGVFVDEVRRKPEAVIEAAANLDPEKVIDSIIKMYQREGKSHEWILMRINSKIHRAAFTSALKAATAELSQNQYGLATNEIYLGLWERTAKKLKEEMDLPKSANLRDHQPIAALYYQGLVEDGCARELGDKQELTWGEALVIVQDVAQFIGAQARAYGERFNIDLATGKPLLKDKN